jgi:hypothetical protein
MKKKRIFLIGGKARTGKDTCAEYITNTYYFFKKYAFADKIKEYASIMYGVPIEYFYEKELKEKPLYYYNNVLYTPRIMLQLIGEETRKRFGEDIWCREVEKEFSNNCNVVISDLRFNHEYEYFKNNKKYKVTCIKLIKDDAPEVGIKNHSTEVCDIDKHVDCVIYNNTTMEELYRQIDEFINTLRKK